MSLSVSVSLSVSRAVSVGMRVRLPSGAGNGSRLLPEPEGEDGPGSSRRCLSGLSAPDRLTGHRSVRCQPQKADCAIMLQPTLIPLPHVLHALQGQLMKAAVTAPSCLRIPSGH